MVLNITFNNISYILWSSVLLVEETGIFLQILNVTDIISDSTKRRFKQ